MNNNKIRKKDWETDERYNRRVWFIKKYKGNKKESVRLSNIWVNMLILHCRYPDKLEKIIYKHLSNINKK